MNTFIKPLQELAEYEEIRKKLKNHQGILQISGCMESQKAHLIYGLSGLFPCRLIIAEDEQKAKELCDDLKFYDKEAMYYPAKDLLFFQADIQGNLLIRQRMKVIRTLLEKDTLTVVTTIDGCMDYLMPLIEINRNILKYDQESQIDIAELAKKLVHLGYERVGQVETAGQFSIRGGIVDIFSLTEDNPWRIELWDDQVDSIRSFDVQSQRSLENLDKISIYPAIEWSGKKNMVTLLDYFPEKQTLIILDEPNHLLERGEVVEEEIQSSRMHREKEGEASLPEKWLVELSAVQKRLNELNCVSVSSLEPRIGKWKITDRYDLMIQSVSSYHSNFEVLTKELLQYKEKKYRVALLSGSRTRAERLAGDLREYGLSSFYSPDLDREIQPGEILVTYGHVKRGFEYPLIKFVVITETDIFGKEQRKKKKKRYDGKRIRDFSELSIGDYVVHENHGVGIYRGIEKIEVEKVYKDYIKIEYLGGSNLYILATQLEALQKYAGAESISPKLNRLGGQEWHKTRTKVKGAVKNIAKELVALYAARQEKDGFTYGEDTIWQKEFEEMFPYEETTDQIQAIEDTKRDMQSSKIMDRLICGDVGYGKTEIAIRAAFKAVQESRQVVYLVPTTILAQQHYNTFVQRMKDYDAVRIDLLCRFCTPTQQKKTIADLKAGKVDIVIGTHRLLSKDVEFKNLGLLIIDEEQRFGVTHKEKIKQMRKNVDVLTLTATPIPRTLHMSLIGIRDMSVLEEPPQDRTAIQTYVMEYNKETVREAINRELHRGGQVYYVYNRVTDIASITNEIAKLVPEARVEFAHGQMKERELEKVMYDFINGDTDVLVTTTIIETGLDISNANTMIIHDSERYGLSQLYQLRGRIGRSNRTAYAFLMYKKNQILKETAEKRLAAIREFTDLGSGFKIAMRDLELRGAGNLLGGEQHGHMNAVGYDLYCKLLTEAVREEKGIQTMEDFETTVDVDLDAYIPETYIQNEYQKLDIYKRIAGIETQDEYDDMLEELIDRFGEPPKAVMNLLLIVAMKAEAHAAYVQEVKQSGHHVKVILYENAKLDSAGIFPLVQKYRRRLVFKVDKKNPYFLLETTGNVLQGTREFLGELRKLVLEQDV